MDENLADEGGRPPQKLFNLYEKWGKSGAGILITGNVMIDANALVQLQNMVVVNEDYLLELQKWAKVAQKQGSQL